MPAGSASPALERWTALALLLPPLALAWPGPGSLLWDDFVPQATGAGAVALAALPAALLLLLRRGPTAIAGAGLLLLLALAGAARDELGDVTDTFEARRALVQAAASVLMLLGGASLSAPGLRVLARGFVAVALLLLVVALADADGGHAGALGNTGSIAMASLPGALAGVGILLVDRGVWRIAGGAAFGLFLAFVLRAPAIGGGLAAAAGIAALAATAGRRARSVPIALAVLAALCALGPALRPSGPPEPAGAAANEAGSPDVGSTGGFAVRARVWRASLGILRDHPLLGAGTGQFAAAFPPYRDPSEIELSTHGRALGVETEVEHPHSDWLLPALELGVVGGLAWLAFLALVAAGAWRALREGTGERAALAAVSVGVLAYAAVHAPLSSEPAAAALAFAAFGAVLSRPGAFRPWPVLLVVLAAPPALAFVRHGRALARLARPGEIEAAEASSALGTALAACPDSPVALSLRARLLETRGEDPEGVRRAWSRVLAVRPHRVEARMQLAFAALRAGDVSAARAEYERALALDPGHPGIRRNLRLLDLREGELGAGREWLGGEDPPANACYERSRELREQGQTLLADLFEARAHLLWAREHAAAGNFANAARSYRQCLRVAREHADEGPQRIRLELAAALLAAGRGAEARAELAPIPRDRVDWSALPAWAAERLRVLAPGG